MAADRLTKLMRKAPVPDSAAARERTAAAAREATPSPAEESPAPARRPVRAAVGLACAVALAAMLLTAPGRSALSQAAELVGLGEVGGSPTLQEPRHIEEQSAPIVIDNGRAPDGSRYELVAYRGGFPPDVKPPPGAPAGFGCIDLEWPGAERAHARTGACFAGGTGASPGAVSGIRIGPRKLPATGAGEGDLVLSGTTRPDVHRLRIVYEDIDGESRDLAVDFSRVDGELLDRSGWSEPFGTFVAFLPADTLRADRLMERFRVTLLTPNLPGFVSTPIEEMPEYWRPAERCARRVVEGGRKAGAFTVIAYDGSGHEVERTRMREAMLPAECEHLHPARRAAEAAGG